MNNFSNTAKRALQDDDFHGKPKMKMKNIS